MSGTPVRNTVCGGYLTSIGDQKEVWVLAEGPENLYLGMLCEPRGCDPVKGQSLWSKSRAGGPRAKAKDRETCLL